MKKLLLGLAAALLPTVACAVPLKPGDKPVKYLPLPGTTAAAEPYLAGSVIKDDLVPFKITADLEGKKIVGQGTVQVRVVKNKKGTLDFYWRIKNSKNSLPIIDFEVRGDPYNTFTDSTYEVNWRLDGVGTVAPATIIFKTAGPSGNSYEFDFSKNPVMPGTSSRFFYFKTSATKTGKARVAPSAYSTWSAEFDVVGPAF